MHIEEILSRIDHTNLSPTAKESDITRLIDEAIKYKTASVCIPPCFVKFASEYAKGKTKICTVIGFPNGYSTAAAKCFEAQEAVKNGADEIDMVINLSFVKDKKFDDILNEINLVKTASCGKILKVIVETCYLTEEEKIKLCSVVSSSDADYIKTSTGFGSGGATFDDVALFANCVSNGTKIKAAGGISSLEDAENFINLGADRLGTSRIIKILSERN